MPCHLDEFVRHVAVMLAAGTSQKEIDRFLATLQPEYRAEVLTAAREVVQDRQGKR